MNFIGGKADKMQGGGGGRLRKKVEGRGLYRRGVKKTICGGLRKKGRYAGDGKEDKMRGGGSVAKKNGGGYAGEG